MSSTMVVVSEYIIASAMLIAAGLLGVVLMPANGGWHEIGRMAKGWNAEHHEMRPIFAHLHRPTTTTRRRTTDLWNVERPEIGWSE